MSHCLIWLHSVSHILINLMELLHVSQCFWLSITVSHSSMELLQVSQCLLSLLDFSCCSFGHMEFLHVFHCHFMFLAVHHRLYQYNGDVAYLPLSPFVPCSLSLSLRSHGVAACLLLSLILLAVTHCLSQFHGASTCP